MTYSDDQDKLRREADSITNAFQKRVQAQKDQRLKQKVVFSERKLATVKQQYMRKQREVDQMKRDIEQLARKERDEKRAIRGTGTPSRGASGQVAGGLSVHRRKIQKEMQLKILEGSLGKHKKELEQQEREVEKFKRELKKQR